MKITNEYCFSNGTEFMAWHYENCEKCGKAIDSNERDDGTYAQYRCSIQRDIEAQAAGLEGVNVRSYKATRGYRCPYFRSKDDQAKRNKHNANNRKYKDNLQIFE